MASWKNDWLSILFTKSTSLYLLVSPYGSQVWFLLQEGHRGAWSGAGEPGVLGDDPCHCYCDSMYTSVLSISPQWRRPAIFSRKGEPSSGWYYLTTATNCLFSPWQFSLPSRSEFISVLTANDNCFTLLANSCPPSLQIHRPFSVKTLFHLSLLFQIRVCPPTEH